MMLKKITYNMPKTCCAVGCSNHSIMLRKLSFHKFPKDENKCALWLTALKKNNPDGTVWMPTKNSVLCGAHFISGNLIILMKVFLSELVQETKIFSRRESSFKFTSL